MRQQPCRGLLVLLPSLRISGGVQETLRLAQALSDRGVAVRILVLWKHEHESPTFGLTINYLSNFVPRKSRSAFEFPLLLFRFLSYLRRLRKGPGWGSPALLLTHFSTFPFAWLAPKLPRFCFNQDLEWKFVPGPLRTPTRWLILFTSRRSKVITTNDFISQSYRDLHVTPFAQVSLWTAPFWMERVPANGRPFDVAMLLRYGSVKRPDLYFELLDLLAATSLRCAVITPETALYEEARPLVEHALLRPSNEELRAFYGSCRIFVLLSDTEGFGLPPLEAMGSGCVPLCRDSGGVRCYMNGSFSRNLIPAEESMSQVLKRIEALIERPHELADLSATARNVFEEGFHECERERTAAFDRIANELSGIADG